MQLFNPWNNKTPLPSGQLHDSGTALPCCDWIKSFLQPGLGLTKHSSMCTSLCISQSACSLTVTPSTKNQMVEGGPYWYQDSRKCTHPPIQVHLYSPMSQNGILTSGSVVDPHSKKGKVSFGKILKPQMAPLGMPTLYKYILVALDKIHVMLPH